MAAGRLLRFQEADGSPSTQNIQKVVVSNGSISGSTVTISGGGVSIGDTVTSATAGSVFFAGAAGVMAQDNAGFFYDDANNQLKLTASAIGQTPLQINLFSGHTANALEVKNSGGTTLTGVTKDGYLSVASSSAYNVPCIFATGDTNTGFAIDNLDRILLITGGSETCYFSTDEMILGSGASVKWDSNAIAGGGTRDTGLARTAAGIVKITNGSTGAGALHLQEQTAPSAPATNNVYIYAQDNGAGKTQLMALFPTGAAQQIAIEP